MTASTFDREDLMPKSADGISRGMLLAIVVHVGLVIALTLGVSWKASEPEGVEAELWAAVPQIAAQRAMEPEPAPKPTPKPEPRPEPKPEPKPEPRPQQPDPQIAIEKAKQEKLKKQKEEEKREREEKEKLAQKKAAEEKKAEAEKRKKEEERLAAQREANIKRILGEAGATGTSPGGKAQVTAGPSASWAGRVIARVKPNIVYPDAISGDPAITVELKLAPNGTIISRKLVKGSGDSRLDDALLRAIDKTEQLPPDTDGTVPSSVEFVFRPGRF